MTMARQPDDHDAVTQQFLTDLDRILDVEAGLREVMLNAQHATFARALDHVLDVEAGLREILPTSSAAQRPPRLDHAATDILQLVSAHSRLLLRKHPNVVAKWRQLRRTKGLVYSLERELGGAVTSTNHLFSLVNSAEEAEWDRVASWLFSLKESLEKIIIRFQDLIEELGDAAATESASVIDMLKGLLQTVRALYDDSQKAWHAHQESHVDHIHAQQLLKQRHRITAGLETARGCAIRQSLAAIDARVQAINEAIRTVLGRFDLPAFTATSVEDFLDDFTTSDLRDLDLADVDLAGVRWSLPGTLWPSLIDIEDMKARSFELEEEPGTYVVHRGRATVRDFVELG
ncbi:hypothetical protein HD597_012871 [Nonomuraea thailandensis]|uniref:Uncharacterized protein n=1 Tax=Nonomuraea thailandensis TaxID=1188745 RepID=A0A9X2K9H3_9ACTN|nr:hypothetical protein [Nonomuraea thailandensis]MCP2365767.1 hypothetical protein [Nonomuraea thailandensis]